MTGKIILIEGLDMTGKTSIAKMMLENMESSRKAYLHTAAPACDVPTVEYCMPLRLAALGYTMICDRWHLGEMVWSHIFGRPPIFTYQQLPMLEKRMQQYHAPVECYYFERNLDELEAIMPRLDERHPRYDVRSAYSWYDMAMERSTFDWRVTNYYEMMNEVQSWN